MKTLIITSRTNETVTSLSKLKDKKGREEQMRYLCEGYKLCCDAVGYVKTEVAVVREDKANDKKFIDLCERSGADMHDVVADQQCGQRLVEVVKNILRMLRAALAVFRTLAEAKRVDGGESRLRCGEVTAANDQKQ